MGASALTSRGRCIDSPPKDSPCVSDIWRRWSTSLAALPHVNGGEWRIRDGVLRLWECSPRGSCIDKLPSVLLELTPDRRSPARARGFALLVLKDLGASESDAQDAALIATELVTNSIIHAEPSTITLAIAATGSMIEIRVTDDGHGTPELRQGNQASITGRGLRFLDQLSTRWMVEQPESGPGKTVVVHLQIPVGVTHDRI